MHKKNIGLLLALLMCIPLPLFARPPKHHAKPKPQQQYQVPLESDQSMDLSVEEVEAMTTTSTPSESVMSSDLSMKASQPAQQVTQPDASSSNKTATTPQAASNNKKLGIFASMRNKLKKNKVRYLMMLSLGVVGVALFGLHKKGKLAEFKKTSLDPYLEPAQEKLEPVKDWLIVTKEELQELFNEWLSRFNEWRNRKSEPSSDDSSDDEESSSEEEEEESLTQEKKSAVAKNLIKRGKMSGVLPYEEVNEFIENHLTKSEGNELLNALEKENIDLVMAEEEVVGPELPPRGDESSVIPTAPAVPGAPLLNPTNTTTPQQQRPEKKIGTMVLRAKINQRKQKTTEEIDRELNAKAEEKKKAGSKVKLFDGEKIASLQAKDDSAVNSGWTLAPGSVSGAPQWMDGLTTVQIGSLLALGLEEEQLKLMTKDERLKICKEGQPAANQIISLLAERKAWVTGTVEIGRLLALGLNEEQLILMTKDERFKICIEGQSAVDQIKPLLAERKAMTDATTTSNAPTPTVGPIGAYNNTGFTMTTGAKIVAGVTERRRRAAVVESDDESEEEFEF